MPKAGTGRLACTCCSGRLSSTNRRRFQWYVSQLYTRSCHTLAILTLSFVLSAVKYVNGRGPEFAYDKVSFEKAFKVCSVCLAVLTGL